MKYAQREWHRIEVAWRLQMYYHYTSNEKKGKLSWIKARLKDSDDENQIKEEITLKSFLF